MMHAVDLFIIFDDVQFTKRTYITRNQILLNGKEHRFSLPVLGASQNKTIMELEADPNLDLLETIRHAYAKAPYFDPVLQLVLRILRYREKNLAKFLGHSLQVICNYIGIETKLIYSSDVALTETGKQKIIPLCKHFSTHTYINREGGVKIYNPEDFSREGIDLRFITMDEDITTRPRFLSIIDTLMYYSPEAMQAILNKCQLKEAHELL